MFKTNFLDSKIKTPWNYQFCLILVQFLAQFGWVGNCLSSPESSPDTTLALRAKMVGWQCYVTRHSCNITIICHYQLFWLLFGAHKKDHILYQSPSISIWSYELFCRSYQYPGQWESGPQSDWSNSRSRWNCEPESHFVKSAEANVRDAFASIESIVTTFTSVS